MRRGVLKGRRRSNASRFTPSCRVLQLSLHDPRPSSCPVSRVLRSCISLRITRVIPVSTIDDCSPTVRTCYSLQLVCGAVRRFKEIALLFGDMHGLVFRRSIHYWQDQPGSLTTGLIKRLPTVRPSSLITLAWYGLLRHRHIAFRRSRTSVRSKQSFTRLTSSGWLSEEKRLSPIIYRIESILDRVVSSHAYSTATP